MYQNFGNGVVGQHVAQIGQSSLDAGSPPSRFSCAMRTTNASTSAKVRARPGIRDALPSYFSGISLRYHANKVSAVTIVGTRASSLRPNVLALPAHGVRRH